MIVERLKLKNFLSYLEAEIEFSAGLNVIVGKNAVGKTNIVDAIYIGGVGRSSKGLKDKEIINWNAKADDVAYTKLDVKKEFSHHTLEFVISKQGKRIEIDGMPIAKLGEIMGVLNVVFFSPDEIKLIKESPEYRRRFLDISLSQQDKRYFYSLVKYNKYLEQRNKILKNEKDDRTKIAMLEVVNPYLAEHSAYIADKRYEFIDRLSKIAEDKHLKLTEGKEKLAISYIAEFSRECATKENYLDLLTESMSKDIKLQFTSTGIHRDDVKISAGGVDIRKYGSQGQQRTSALSLKLAETELFKMTTGEYPVLLLDDVSSELDAKRKKALFAMLDGIQTIVTCTAFDRKLADNYDRFTIKDNKITKVKITK